MSLNLFKLVLVNYKVKKKQTNPNFRVGKRLSRRGLASDARDPGFHFQYWEVGNTKKIWLRSLSSPETSSVVARVRTYGEKRPQTLKGLTRCCLVRTDCLSAFPRGPLSGEKQNSHKHRGLGGWCAVGKHNLMGTLGSSVIRYVCSPFN